MREDLTLTITSVRGAKHYALGKIMRYILLIVGGSLLALLVVSVCLTFWLRSEVGALEYERAELEAAHRQNIEQQKQQHLVTIEEREALYQDTLAEQHALYEVLEEERSKVSLLDSALVRIEDLIGTKKDDAENLQARVEIAEQNSVERKLMLSSIPSGYPLRNNTRITSSFGYRIHPTLKYKKFHGGIDFAARVGTPVYATADAVVEFADRHRSGYGKLIILSHSAGFKSMYAHLNTISVRVGQVMKKGDMIGRTGRTGNVTGPHLHYEISYVQRALNPRYFVRWSLENYEAIFKKEGYVPWEFLVNLTAFRVKDTKAYSQKVTTSADP